MVKQGDAIKVFNYTRKLIATGSVKSVSPSGKRVLIEYTPFKSSHLTVSIFYRDDRQGSDQKTYIQTPGAGQFGHMLNDRFFVQ